MVDYKKIFDYMFNNIYLTPRDLMYNTKYNFCILILYKENMVFYFLKFEQCAIFLYMDKIIEYTLFKIKNE